MIRPLEIEMLTALLEEAGWNSVKGRATMLRFISRHFFEQETWKLFKVLRKQVLGIRTPYGWAQMWVIFHEHDLRGKDLSVHQRGLRHYLTG